MGVVSRANPTKNDSQASLSGSPNRKRRETVAHNAQSGPPQEISLGRAQSEKHPSSFSKSRRSNTKYELGSNSSK